MNTNELVEWQRYSPSNGMVQCWWTWDMLDWIETQDWKNKNVLEFGAGRGTAWLRDRSKFVVSIEADLQWAEQARKDCEGYGVNNGAIYAKQLPDGVQGTQPEYFGMIPTDIKFDVISIDGIYRTEAIEWAIEHLKGREGLLIIDNLDQDFVWISPKAMELIAPYESKVFYQKEHTNHEGKQWNTRWVKIPA
jgi:protein-L-isoaspartate O-methyltransferase